MTSSTTDNDAWLRELRCPQYFDFESALSVPAVPDSSTNPPLRDCVYESDEDTREFFRELDTNPTLHATPHEQILSPLPEKLRNLKPVTHNQLTLSFEEYLEKEEERKRNGEVNTPSKRRNSNSTPNGSPPPNLQRLRRRGSTADSPAKTPRQQRSRLPTYRRPKLGQSSGGVKVPGERAAQRRIRPPERITPPIGSKPSSSGSRKRSGAATVGPGRVNKSRSAILHEEDLRKHRALGTSESSNEQNPSDDKERVEKEPSLAINLPETDNDVLKMVEEHNRRIRRKQNRSDGDAKRIANEGDMDAELSNFKQRAKSLEDKRRRVQTGEDFSHYPRGTRERQLPVQNGGVKKRTGVGSFQIAPRRGSPLASSEIRTTENGREKSTKTTKPVPFSFTTRQKGRSTLTKTPNETHPDEAAFSLEDLLQSENDKIMEKRKRMPERRRAILANKNGILRNVDGENSAYPQKSVTVKTSFTYANEVRSDRNEQENIVLGSATTNMQSLAVSMKQRASENSSAAQTERSRGLRGFRARNQNGQAPRSHHHGNESEAGPSTQPSQMPSACSSLFERRKAEESLSKDLQSILSLHNSKIEGKRKANVDPKR